MFRKLRGLSALWALSACQYDLSGLYEGEHDDAGVDAQVPTDAATRIAPLIEAWRNHPGVDEECMRCAQDLCAAAEVDCRADPSCVEYTNCVAQTPHPAGQAACRARFAAWVGNGDVRARDIAGPYGQCVFRDQCAVQCDGNADLSCVGKYAWPSTADSSVSLHLYLNDAMNQSQMLSQVSVKACYAGDATCATPYSMGITDERGLVDLRLPTSFDRAFAGHLQVEGQGVYPTLLKLGWNLATESTVVVSIVNKSLFDFAVGLTNVTLDPARGMLQTRMLSCQGVGVRGIRFDVENPEPEFRSWYIGDGVPRVDATMTNNIGSGGIFNVSEGFKVALATRVSDNILVARAEAPVRAGFMTIVVFAPLATSD